MASPYIPYLQSNMKTTSGVPLRYGGWTNLHHDLKHGCLVYADYPAPISVHESYA